MNKFCEPVQENDLIGPLTNTSMEEAPSGYVNSSVQEFHEFVQK